MYVYTLFRNDSDNGAFETYDAVHDMVIVGSSPEHARQQAAATVDAESRGVWLDERYSDVTQIGIATTRRPRVVLACGDFA